ncbi:MAG: hypothetical protein LBV33_02070, partial [Lachnospiraceae bacterium]|nr:hypothetical protein [Lachnospiraceae bacterium]
MAVDNRRNTNGRRNGGTATNRSGSNNAVSGRKRARRKQNKIILFIFEIFVLVIMVMFLYGALKVEKTGKIVIPEEDIIINETVKEYS